MLTQGVDKIPIRIREPIQADPWIELPKEHVLVDESLDCRVVVSRSHIQEAAGIGLDAKLAVVLEGGGGETGVVVELAVRSVGETVGDISVYVGEGDRAAASIEMIVRVL